MRAVHARRFGGPEVLEVVDVPAPERPGPGELLVRVEAAGVGPWDPAIVGGHLGTFGFPFTPGADLAGQVLAVGPGVDGFAPGDAVWAYPGLVGAWQEVVTVPATAAARRPRSIDGPEAGGMPVVALTAYQGLVEVLDVQPTESVLITGAGGAVGSIAVQVGAWLGARVIGTASSDDHEWLGGLGATDVLDYGGPWLDQLRDLAYDGVDAVLDLVGGDALTEAVYATRDRGRVATTVVRDEVRTERGITVRWFGSKGTTARLTTLASLVDTGSLQPTTGQLVPIERVAEAFDALRAPHRGKIVLTLD
jgi:NADPH:quinone reductase-like Zn-dependent oxidoreductase